MCWCYCIPVRSQSSLHFESSSTSDYVSLPIAVNTTNTTHEFWFKTTYANGGLFMITDANLGAAHDRDIYIENGDVKAYVWTSSGSQVISTTGTNYADGNWHHVAHVVGASAGGQVLYLDGVMAASGTLSTSGFNWNTVINLGVAASSPTQIFFDGQLDEVRIWNVVRTQAQISATKNCVLVSPQSGLIGNYHFNDGVPNSNNTAITTLADASGQNNNGSLINFALTGTTSNWVGDVTGVGTMPTVIANSSANNVCTGTSITLTGSGSAVSGYSWTGGVTNGSPFAINTTTKYFVSGTNNGCTVQDSITIVVFSVSPSVNLGADGQICAGATMVLNAANPGATYLWSDNSTNQTLSITAAGTYSVTVTNGCGSNSDAISFTSAASPSVNLGPDVWQCNGSITLNAGNPGATYLWSNNSTAQTLLVNTTGIYYVTVEGANGCKTSDTARVTISSALPVINLGADQRVCSTVTSSITLKPNSNDPNVTYLWSTGATSDTLIVTASNTYFITVTNGCGTSKDTVAIAFETLPVVNLGPDIKQCGTAILNAGNPGATFQWSNSATTQSISVSSTGYYWVTVTNTCGQARDEIVANVGTPISLNVGSDVSICSGSSHNINTTISYSTDTLLAEGVSTANFNIPDNSPPGIQSTIVATSSLGASTLKAVILNEINHTWDSDLDINIIAPDGSTIVLTSDNGHSGDDYINTYFSNTGTPITVAAAFTSGSASYAPFTGYFQPEQPFSLLTGSANGNWALKVVDDASIDFGTLKKWTLLYAKEANTVTYSWSPSSGLSANNIKSPVANPTATTTYTLTVTDAYGCTATDNITINVPGGPPSVNLGPDLTHCGPKVLNAGNPGSTYLWSDASIGQTLTATSSGTYFVEVNNGCAIAKDTVVLTINPAPTVNLGADIAQCGGSTLLNAGNAGATYLWSDASTNQTLNVSASGTYSVIVTNAQSCQGKDTVIVYIQSNPTVNLGADITQCGGTASFNAGNPGATYLWHDASTSQSLTISSPGTVQVTVKVTNSCGMVSDTLNLVIHALPTVSLTLNPTTICLSATTHNLSGGSPAGGNYSGTAVAAGVFNATTAGVGTHQITYTYTDANNCVASVQAPLTVSACTNTIPDIEMLTYSQIYPNPNTGKFELTYESVNTAQIEIYSALGDKMDLSLPIVQGGKTSFDLSILPEGIYLMHIHENNKTEIKKLVIQK